MAQNSNTGRIYSTNKHNNWRDSLTIGVKCHNEMLCANTIVEPDAGFSDWQCGICGLSRRANAVVWLQANDRAARLFGGMPIPREYTQRIGGIGGKKSPG